MSRCRTVYHPEDHQDEPATPAKAAPVAAPEIQLSEEQLSVREKLRDKKNLLITGSAGTGKSTLLKHLVDACDGRLPVTATTGIAAVGVSGMTLHSWAGIGLADDEPKALAARIVNKKGEALERIREYNRIAIDEISMMSRELFDKVDWVFRYVRKVHDVPFGGMQLVMFGDFLQLPPVTRGAVDDRNRFCFSAEAWRAAQVETCMLTKVFRQADADWSQALNEIRVGKLTKKTLQMLADRHNSYGKPKDTMPDIRAVTVFTHNADVDMFNHDELEKIKNPEQVFEACDSGDQRFIEQLKKHCLAPTRLTLKIGAQVMLLKNLDPMNGLGNGSVGVVIGFSKFSREPQVKFANGMVRTLDRAKWEVKNCGTTLATRQQIPLRLAWAITVHKSQGMTLDKIEVHLKRAFEDGQAYVAMSRARTIEGLFIKNGNRDCIRANAEALAFYNGTL